MGISGYCKNFGSGLGSELADVQENGPTQIIGIIGGVTFVFSFFLLGIDTIRAGVFMKWPPILLIVAGTTALIYTWVPIGKLLPRIAGVAMLGFGWHLWILAKNRHT
jgi:hypothetical protein